MAPIGASARTRTRAWLTAPKRVRHEAGPGRPTARPTAPTARARQMPAPRTVGTTTELIRNGAPARHDTQVVHQAPEARPDAPPPVVVPPRRPVSARTKRRRRIVVALVAVLLLGAISMLAGVVGVRLWREYNTHVPKVAGNSVAQATSTLRTTGYAVDGAVTNEFSETVPKGVVISTTPTAGTRLSQGQQVRLVVSLGPDRVSVPDTRNLTLSAAESMLQDRGMNFDPTPRTRPSIKVPQGKVITTKPRAGQLMRRSDEVTFVVSSGPPMVRIPAIATGTTYTQANQALTRAHFTVSRVDEYSDTVPVEGVISVDPSGKASYGSTVTVTVSKGPEFVTIPDFGTLPTLGEVQSKLQELGLKVVVQKAFGGHAGRVIQIDPGAGTQVHVGHPVTVTVV